MNTQTVSAILDELTRCVCRNLEGQGAGPTCWCGMIVSGDGATWDFCGECAGDTCGMGYVRLVSIFPYTTFPQPTPGVCASEMGLTLEVGALRCLPIAVESGLPPSPEEIEESTLGVIADMHALQQAIMCCDLPGDPLVEIGTWMAQGPRGGCVGGAWTVQVSDV